jgi:hypothetical protein
MIAANVMYQFYGRTRVTPTTHLIRCRSAVSYMLVQRHGDETKAARVGRSRLADSFHILTKTVAVELPGIPSAGYRTELGKKEY